MNGAASSANEHEWMVDELLHDLVGISGRDFEQGRALFEKALCGRCHAFSSYSEGSGFAPDLSSVGTQFHREFGLIEVEEGKLIVAPSIMSPNVTVEIAEADVVKREPSPISPMPSGLMNTSTRDQVLDLIAFLVSGGNPSAAVFRK